MHAHTLPDLLAPRGQGLDAASEEAADEGVAGGPAGPEGDHEEGDGQGDYPGRWLPISDIWIYIKYISCDDQ